MKKVLIAFAGLALVASLALVAPVSATTVDTAALTVALQALGFTSAQINAVLTALSPATSPATHGKFTTVEVTANLAPGSTGEGVRALQQWLNANGYTVATTGAGSPGMESAYYGALTQAAVGRLQDDLGVPYGAYRGYWGPSTRGAIASSVVADPVDDDDDGDDPIDDDGGLSGGEGYLDVIDMTLSSYDIDLGKSENVMEFELEAVDSDVSVNRIDFVFDARPWLYFDEVNLLADGKEIGSLSGQSDFSEIGSTGDWRARFSGLSEVIEEDSKPEFALEVKVLASMAGGREAHTVRVELRDGGIRAVDGAGLTQYAPDADYGSNVTFTDTFGEGDLTVTISSNSPEKAVIVVEEDSRVINQTVAIFNAKATKGAVSVEKVTVNASAGSGDLDDMIYRARLFMGDSLVANAAPNAGDIVFDRIDKTIAGGSTATFRVEVDFQKASDILTLPNTLTVDEIEVEHENQDFVLGTNVLTIGEEHSILEEGLVPDIVSTSVTEGILEDTAARFTFVVNLTAVGDTFRVAKDGSVTPVLSGAGTGTVGTSTIVSVTGATYESTGDRYRIVDGATAKLTFQVLVSDVDTTGEYRVTLTDLVYGSTTASGYGTLELGAPDYESGNAVITPEV